MSHTLHNSLALAPPKLLADPTELPSLHAQQLQQASLLSSLNVILIQ
jgi:hypothetical protein